MVSERDMFINSWNKEFETTMRVLKQFPQERLDYKPHEKSMSARDLAWVFAAEEITVFSGVAAGKIDWEKMPKAPTTYKEALSQYEKVHKDNAKVLAAMSESDLNQTMKFMVAPKKIGDVRKLDILWMILMDQIHHRGQFSVYLRLVGAKVPSIYGPSADEPWH